MTLNANSIQTNLLVTALVAVMVAVLPWADRRICRRLGVNLQGGVSENPRADSLLQARQLLLYAVFCYVILNYVGVASNLIVAVTTTISLIKGKARSVDGDGGKEEE